MVRATGRVIAHAARLGVLSSAAGRRWLTARPPTATAYRDAEKRRTYMRDLMRRRRAS